MRTFPSLFWKIAWNISNASSVPRDAPPVYLAMIWLG